MKRSWKFTLILILPVTVLLSEDSTQSATNPTGIVIEGDKRWGDLVATLGIGKFNGVVISLAKPGNEPRISVVRPSEKLGASDPLTISVFEGGIAVDSDICDLKRGAQIVRDYLTLSKAAGDEPQFILDAQESLQSDAVRNTIVGLFHGLDLESIRITLPGIPRTSNAPPSPYKKRYTSTYTDPSAVISLRNALAKAELEGPYRLEEGYGGTLDPILALGRFSASNVRPQEIVFSHVYESRSVAGQDLSYRLRLTLAEGKAEGAQREFQGRMVEDTPFVEQLPPKKELISMRSMTEFERILNLNPNAKRFSIDGADLVSYNFQAFTPDGRGGVTVCRIEIALERQHSEWEIYYCVVRYGNLAPIGKPTLRLSELQEEAK